MLPLLVAASLALPRAAGAADFAATLARGHASYFAGEHEKALDAYRQAASISTTSVQPWLNGAVVLEELGRRQEAVRWYEKAARLTTDPAVETALGWARWRAGQLQAAATTFTEALGRQPEEPYALLGLARVDLDRGRAGDALEELQRSLRAAPLLTLDYYYEGQAYEKLGKATKAADAYKQAVIADNYFLEGREALARLFLKQRSYNDAWLQVSKMIDLEPRNKMLNQLLSKLAPLLTKRPGQLRPSGLALPVPYVAASPPGDRVPTIRVGLYTTPMGNPKPRQRVTFSVSCPFDVVDAETGKKLLAGSADDAWEMHLKRVKKRQLVVLVDPSGKPVGMRKKGFTIVPRDKASGLIALDPVPGHQRAAAGKLVRGKLEVTLFRRNLRLVNVVDLENYTQGVVSAEMPIKSPIEALKAQAVVARTHALFIKNVSRRHRKDGYDVCDDQHCQVYAGARAESARSREVVDGTRGRVVTYHGALAHVIYSANCGGHTQSGKDLNGWGDVPYWSGIADAPDAAADPRSPWELRQWLMSWPPAYCKPSADVYPSHFRWARVMTFAELEAKLDRKLHIGKLRALRALRRSPSGNVNTILVEGTRRKVRVKSEFDIRGLLGLGSLRSTQFVIDWDYDAKGKVRAVVFRGGGWGHGVGMCQSGAIGRADAGQTYADIIKAYFKGTQLGQLNY